MSRLRAVGIVTDWACSYYFIAAVGRKSGPLADAGNQWLVLLELEE